MNATEVAESLAGLVKSRRTDELLRGAAHAIEAAGVSDTPRHDALQLLWLATSRPTASFFAFPERMVPRLARIDFADFVARRVRGEPVDYIVGLAGFFSLPFVHVGPEVLVPRPETELLVEATLARCALLNGPTVLDVGTGSGVIAASVKLERRDARVTGVDVSSAALELASMNGCAAMRTLEPMIRWIESNWFEALPGERFDLIVSNPPYVRTADIVGSLTYEPRVALDGGADGLDAYRVLFADAADHLNAGGALLVEHGAEQRPALVALAAAHGWRIAAARDDLAGRPRVLELERSGVS